MHTVTGAGAVCVHSNWSWRDEICFLQGMTLDYIKVCKL